MPQTHTFQHENPNYYDYRSTTTTTTMSPEPILYNYSPPAKDSSSSEEDTEKSNTVSDPNDYFAAGVENMMLYAQYKDNQHLVLLVVQGSDGLSEASSTNDDTNDNETNNLQYYPDIEYVFFSDAEPDESDLEDIARIQNQLMNNNC